MQVPHDKEVAIHVVPESCVARREVRGEALTGVRAIGVRSCFHAKVLPLPNLGGNLMDCKT